MNAPTCAISIATLNRLGELRRTLAVVAALDPQPDELLICADGCTDGTAAYVREHFPHAKLIEHARPNGSIRSRIELMHAAQSDIVISLDDDSYPSDSYPSDSYPSDSYPSDSSFIARVRELFASMPHVAVASFPQRTDEFPETLHAQNFGPPRYTANYVNAAAAFRRGVYMRLEGWPADFEHAYDESDYTLQCLAAGYAVYFEPSIVIRHHFTGVERNEIRTHHRHARNEQWCAWRRCPFPSVLAVSLYRAITQFGYAWKRGLAWVVREPRWWLMALRGLPAVLRSRRPVPARVYRQWLRLIRHPIESAEKWQAAFGRE